MSSADDVKVTTTYFTTQTDEILLNKFVTELTPLRIIKFQKYFQKCAINIPMNGEALSLLGTVLADADYKVVNNNQTWVAPTDPGTAPVLPTASVKGTSTISELDKSIEHTNCPLQHQHNVRQHKKNKMKYDKYKAVLTALCNLITSNIK